MLFSSRELSLLSELGKNGLSFSVLEKLSYRSEMGKSLVNSLRKFGKEELFKELSRMIRFYQEAETLDNVDLDYRVNLGFRMLVNDYNTIRESELPAEIRIVDMSYGKANDDGYRGVHIYFQRNH